MEQLLTHIFGDYILQTDYMAMNKAKRIMPCLLHVLVYTACFLLLTTSWKALLVIGATHFILDHWHTPLKRFIWLKGHVNPGLVYPEYGKCSTTGFYDDAPYNLVHFTSGDGSTARYSKPRLFFISMWLYIIHDNFIHLCINYFALKYLS